MEDVCSRGSSTVASIVSSCGVNHVSFLVVSSRLPLPLIFYRPIVLPPFSFSLGAHNFIKQELPLGKKTNWAHFQLNGNCIECDERT